MFFYWFNVKLFALKHCKINYLNTYLHLYWLIYFSCTLFLQHRLDHLYNMIIIISIDCHIFF